MILSEDKPKKEEKQFVVNPKYCEKHGVNKQAAEI